MTISWTCPSDPHKKGVSTASNPKISKTPANLHVSHVSRQQGHAWHATIWYYMTICAGRYTTVSEFNLMTVSWYSLASQGAWNQTFYTPYVWWRWWRLIIYCIILHQQESQLDNLACESSKAPRRQIWGCCLASQKKKKTDKTSTLGEFIWLNNLPSESKLMMCRHLSNWFKLLDTVFVAFTALILTASSRVLTRSSTSSTHGVDEAHSPHEESLRRTSQVVWGNG